MPRKDLNALEAGHRKHRWSPAQDRIDMRAALRAIPPNLFGAIIAAAQDNTPHGETMRQTILAENEARYRQWLRNNPNP